MECRGPVFVLQALYDVISPVGTLVMPSQSQDLTDPSRWENPAVPSEWRAEIRSSTPAFNRALTPTRDMGRIAELFRPWPGVIRSEHPTGSFTAFGPESAFITRVQPLTDPFGDASPLRKLYELDATVLLLGVSFVLLHGTAPC
ncbi:aminoglycoside n3'-acetyltransferase [Gluconobacter frateurii NBRC 103465]|nr:aminoglycoside n3'-acetyltransferase [Gluconobacter frateurii NBRC 103465]